MASEEVLKALRCMVHLEKSVASFYEKLATALKNTDCSAAISFVAMESQNHAKLLESLYGSDPLENCVDALGSIAMSCLERIKEIESRLDKGWVPCPGEVAAILEETNDVERLAGEEVYAQIAAVALGAHLTGLQRELLMAIAEEEKKHYEIVKKVAEELKRPYKAAQEENNP